VKNGRNRPFLYLQTSTNDKPHNMVKGFIPEGDVKKIFARAGLDYEEQKSKAATRNFKPFSLKQRCSLILQNTSKKLVSKNFLALVEGNGPNKKDVIVYSAHWDHLGVIGDEIMYGARDNALSVAALLVLAEAFIKNKTKLNRSILLLIPTAEEQGLLGSLHFAQHPLYEFKHIVACINMDIINIFGKTKDITFYGWGYSSLDDYAIDVAKRQGRVVNGDPTPENGMFYRSDHFMLAQKGVPALFINMGYEHIEHGKEWMLNKQKEWTNKCYHKTLDACVTDTNSEWCWNLDGAVQDLELIYNVGTILAQGSSFPQWREGTEFKHVRDEYMNQK